METTEPHSVLICKYGFVCLVGLLHLIHSQSNSFSNPIFIFFSFFIFFLFFCCVLFLFSLIFSPCFFISLFSYCSNQSILRLFQGTFYRHQKTNIFQIFNFLKELSLKTLDLTLLSAKVSKFSKKMFKFLGINFVLKMITHTP